VFHIPAKKSANPDGSTCHILIRLL